MMGRTHAATGALAGLLIGPLVGLESVPELVPFAAVTAGYALVPDLDHPEATASRLLGPITGLVSMVLRAGSRVLYALTKGSRDEDCNGTHRHLSHTLLFAVLLGGICSATTAAGGAWVVTAWLLLGVLLAVDQLGIVGLVGLGAGAASWVPAVAAGTMPIGQAALSALTETAGWLGIAIAAGCFVHCLGDAVTRSGCPFLFPIPIAGETWYELRPPRWLRFRTNGGFERRVVYPFVVVGCALAVPGVFGWVRDLVVLTATPGG
jgi:membrane-bound metal-dependent hydrolase YbcI (DUF457 family)